jgi:hypothetical protein
MRIVADDVSGSTVLISHVTAGKEARTAEDGTTLRRVEGHSGLLAALCAVDRDLDPLSHAGGVRGGDGGESLVLGLLSGLAAFRLVL